MASMMGGDFVEAYVMRRIYKEKMEEMEMEMQEKKKSHKEIRRKNYKKGFGFFGMSKKKVAPTTSSSVAQTKP